MTICLICAQTDKVDSTLKDSALLRAFAYKYRTAKLGFCMRVSSKLFEKPFNFTHLPRSPIKFDQDRIAEWSEFEGIVYSDLAEEIKVATLYGEGYSMNKIGKSLGLHDETVKRHIRKVLNAFIKQERIEIVNKEF